MKGIIESIDPKGIAPSYRYLCRGDDGPFSFRVEFSHHRGILDCEGRIIGREIEYHEEMDPSEIKFLD